jgi:ribosomal protein S18 acetylase RimI-like enzyme
MVSPRPTEGAPRTELEELLYSIRQELIRREEAPSGDWVESSANDLVSGTKPGWYLPVSEGGALAFYARRGREAYGHVHAGVGDGPREAAGRVAIAMLDGLPPEIASIDVGFTGLSSEHERDVVAELLRRPGSSAIERQAMERAITPADADPGLLPPTGARAVPVRDVTLDALADLDRRSFRGTVDERLLGPRVEEYRHVLGAILDGSLGRFLDEASTALVAGDPPRLVGALLTSEQSARRAIFVDLMVDPELRRRGYGLFLLKWGVRALRATGHGRVRLWVTVANAAARGLYERFGFTTTARATIYRWERSAGSPQAQTAR